MSDIVYIRQKYKAISGKANDDVPIYAMRQVVNAYEKGRADVLREHREQCNGKCFRCEVSVPFINSDGEEVILPYSYSYKTDCEDNRYINAKEVLSLINTARADGYTDALHDMGNSIINLLDGMKSLDKIYKTRIINHIKSFYGNEVQVGND